MTFPSLKIICVTLFLSNYAQGQIACKSSLPNNQQLKKIKQLQTNTSKSNDIIVIPVVFHVLHQFGNENITDEQILNQIQLLNRDFQKLNEDTTFVQTPFDTIIGNAGFEFRLATIDPNGNPTNGIDRIPTSLTNMATKAARINAWNSENYYNIWVVNSMLEPVSGETTNPYDTTNFTCVDGTMIIHSYVGNIGTGNTFTAHALTHEAGHFFGLYHINHPETDCTYSDGIVDTPTGIGEYNCNLSSNTCDNSSDAEAFGYWGFDPRDMIENFMTSSYCQRMFTNNQASLLRAVAIDSTLRRFSLSSPSNLLATGTVSSHAHQPYPIADFSVRTGLFCVGDSVSFINGNPSVDSTSYTWSFPGGNPSNSNLKSPKVSYAQPGFYSVTLTATSSLGTITKTLPNSIYISEFWSEFSGPTVQDFNQGPNWWITQSPFSENTRFQLDTLNGTNNSPCFVLKHVHPTFIDSCTYIAQQNRGTKDYLVSPSFDLSTTSNIQFSFDYAYATAATAVELMKEELKVYSSRDCGKTWTFRKSLSDTNLVTRFTQENTEFFPLSTEWKTATFNYTSNALDTKTRFRFEFSASEFSKNVYIDNVRIDGLLSLENQQFVGMISPNPVQSGQAITVELVGSLSDFTFFIHDVSGKTMEISAVSISDQTVLLNLPGEIASGFYFLEVKKLNNAQSYKICVQK